MKFSPNLSTSLAASAFLLAGSFALAQTTSTARNMHPRDAASGHASGMQAQPGARNVQQYREAEDMHTRYRSGNIQNNTTHSANDATAQGADVAQPQSTPKKHIAGVKYEDRLAGDNPGEAAAQSSQGSAQRKDGSIVHADYLKSADRNSAHATESLRTSGKAKTGENPLYEGGGKSGTNPLYESGKRQSAVTSGNPGPSPETQRPKRPGRMKYGSIRIR